MKIIYFIFSISINSVLATEFIEASIIIDGTERNYVYKFADDNDKNKKQPVVIALHGGGSNWKKMNKGTTKDTLNKAVNNYQMLLIFPEGKNQHWNDGRNENIQGDEKLDDVEFISQLIDKTIREYNVDADKVYIAGMSNGGFMAIRLAIEIPNKISAVAAVSAQLGDNIKHLKAKSPVSFMLINGTKDPIVPYYGGEMKMFKFSKNLGLVLSTKKTINYFVYNNHCNKTPSESFQNKRKFDQTTVTYSYYSQCDENTQIKLVTINSGGHTWPGGKQYLPKGIIGRVSKEFKASDLMLEFFIEAPARNK